MARGSHATWGAYDSRICIICGRPIRITLEAAWMHTDNQTGEHRSAHVPCGSPLNRRITMMETTTPEPEPSEPTPTEPDPEGDNDDASHHD